MKNKYAAGYEYLVELLKEEGKEYREDAEHVDVDFPEIDAEREFSFVKDESPYACVFATAIVEGYPIGDLLEMANRLNYEYSVVKFAISGDGVVLRCSYEFEIDPTFDFVDFEAVCEVINEAIFLFLEGLTPNLQP